MNQQINFYLPEFRMRRKVLTARSTARVFAAVIAAMALLYLFGLQAMHSVDREYAVVSGQESVAAERLEKLQPIIGNLGDGKTWEQRVQEKEAQLEEKRMVLQYVRHTDLGETQGFSRHMQSLARIELEGIWLTRVRLSAGGAGTVLEGNALQPELVATYLQFLASETPFAEQRFRRFEIEGDTENGNGPVRFSLVSEPDSLAQTVGAR